MQNSQSNIIKNPIQLKKLCIMLSRISRHCRDQYLITGTIVVQEQSDSKKIVMIYVLMTTIMVAMMSQPEQGHCPLPYQTQIHKSCGKLKMHHILERVKRPACNKYPRFRDSSKDFNLGGKC